MFIGHINIEIFKMTLILEAPGFFYFCWTAVIEAS